MSRALNRALHTIVVSRRKRDPATIACLKRYLARHLYRLLEAGPVTT